MLRALALMVQRRWHRGRSGFVRDFQGLRDEAVPCVLEQPWAALGRCFSPTGFADRAALTAIICRLMPLASAVPLASPAAV